jgi:hypothetical protein
VYFLLRCDKNMNILHNGMGVKVAGSRAATDIARATTIA